MNNARFRNLRSKVKSLLDFTDFEVMKWWITPNDAFNGKSPSEMAEKHDTFKEMEDIILYSEVDISGGMRQKNNFYEKNDLPDVEA